MQVVSIKGSPRKKGNSSALADVFTAKAREKGATVLDWNLNELDFRGCQACMYCKTKQEDCAVQDDLTQIMDAVKNADIVVLATPVYFGDISSQAKTFVDRTFSFLIPDFITAQNPGRLQPGKKFLFIQCQGFPDENVFNDIYPKYSNFFKWHGFEETELLRACGFNEPGAAVEDPETSKQLEELAARML